MDFAKFKTFKENELGNSWGIIYESSRPILKESIETEGTSLYYDEKTQTGYVRTNDVLSFRKVMTRFNGCIYLTSIGIFGPEIGPLTFEGCHGLSEIYMDGVKTIRQKAFKDCMGLHSISIPDAISKIGFGMFEGCRNLTSIELPQHCNLIEFDAFKDCSSLVHIVLPSFDDVFEAIGRHPSEQKDSWHHLSSYIANYVFEGCTSLPVYNNARYADTYLIEAMDKTADVCSIKEGTKFIGARAFKDCNNLTSIEIPEGVVAIGADAFSGCINLRTVILPSTLKIIDEGAFNKCHNLQDVVLPSDLKAIGHSAFRNCSQLKEIVIPSGLRYVGPFAFSDSGISKVSLPEDLIDFDRLRSACFISDDAFDGCEQLPVINNIRYADTILLGPIDKTWASFYILPGTKIISRRAFYGCENLTAIVIPDSVRIISESAFQGCSKLAMVKIKHVDWIQSAGFKDCPSLSSITLEGVPSDNITEESNHGKIVVHADSFDPTCEIMWVDPES